jgi:hypothetical protein
MSRNFDYSRNILKQGHVGHCIPMAGRSGTGKGPEDQRCKTGFLIAILQRFTKNHADFFLNRAVAGSRANPQPSLYRVIEVLNRNRCRGILPDDRIAFNAVSPYLSGIPFKMIPLYPAMLPFMNNR